MHAPCRHAVSIKGTFQVSGDRRFAAEQICRPLGTARRPCVASVADCMTSAQEFQSPFRAFSVGFIRKMVAEGWDRPSRPSRRKPAESYAAESFLHGPPPAKSVGDLSRRRNRCRKTRTGEDTFPWTCPLVNRPPAPARRAGGCNFAGNVADSVPVPRRGCSSMAEWQPSKLFTRVRFPSPAPISRKRGFRAAGGRTAGRRRIPAC